MAVRTKKWFQEMSNLFAASQPAQMTGIIHTGKGLFVCHTNKHINDNNSDNTFCGYTNGIFFVFLVCLLFFLLKWQKIKRNYIFWQCWYTPSLTFIVESLDKNFSSLLLSKKIIPSNRPMVRHAFKKEKKIEAHRLNFSISALCKR